MTRQEVIDSLREIFLKEEVRLEESWVIRHAIVQLEKECIGCGQRHMEVES